MSNEVRWVGDMDIYRAANVLLKQHGAAADFLAAQRIDALSAVGDLGAARVWRRILRAIETLTWVAVPGEKMH